jgi:hypothetical protein
MRLRFPIFLAALASILSCAGCGTPGAVQLPSLNLARPVEDLTASRKGNTVRLEWTLPEKNTDRTLVQLKRLGDTLVCRDTGTTLMSNCKEVGSVTPPKGPQRKKNDPEQKLRMNYSDTLPVQLEEEDPAGFVTYAVEIMNQQGRSAGLSNQVAIPLAPTIAPPSQVSAQVGADGVRVSWSGGEQPTAPEGLTYRYRIERRPAGAGGYIALNDVDPAADGSYLDQTFQWETKYQYRITSVTNVRAGDRQASVEGDDSAPTEVFTKDVYPPAQPVGLQAVFSSVGQKPFVDLTWAPNSESDVAGYNVYRRSAGEEWQKLNPKPTQVPSFRDDSVQPGTKYEYAVSAVDLRGNESVRSEATSEEVPSKQ